MIDAALAYAKQGLQVFPTYGIMPVKNTCTCYGRKPNCSKGKHPCTRHGLKDATTDRKRISGWKRKWDAGANVAIVGGDGLLIIDVDNTPERDGASMPATLELEHGQLPRHWSVRTGGGGEHLYFSVPSDVRIRDPNRWKGEGVEIKSTGTYVVCPPSRHESGQCYEWITRSGDRPPCLPDAWLDLLRVRDSAEPTMPSGEGLHKFCQRPERPQSAPSTDNQINKPLVFDCQVICTDTAVTAVIANCVELTYPRRVGTRNHQLIELARQLARNEELRAKDAEWFRPVIERWLSKAAEFIGPRVLDESMAEWNYIWGVWLDDTIENPVFKASEHMKHRPLPAIPAHYRSETARRLVALCAAMADVAADGDGVWFIPCRTAARVLGLDPETNYGFIAGVFQKMVRDGILEPVGERKRGSMKAPRYRYIGWNADA